MTTQKVIPARPASQSNYRRLTAGDNPGLIIDHDLRHGNALTEDALHRLLVLDAYEEKISYHPPAQRRDSAIAVGLTLVIAACVAVMYALLFAEIVH